MTPTLREAIRFFAEHAGYYTPPGRMACAKKLALAEERARDLRLRFAWEDEQRDEWDGEYPLASTDLLEWCACYDRAPSDDRWRNISGAPKARCLASLCMIATTGYRDPYRRVVEAELASEALATLDAERDAGDCARAEEMRGRATFAGVAP
jgi:hypothetical protein